MYKCSDHNLCYRNLYKGLMFNVALFVIIKEAQPFTAGRNVKLIYIPYYVVIKYIKC